MSTPAWKPLPSARRTTTRVLRSRPAARKASASWNQPATGSAFTGGLSIVRMTTCSRVSERIMRGSILPDMFGDGGASLWHATLPAEEQVARGALDGDVVADVAIAGGGYAGRWDVDLVMRAVTALRAVVCDS